MSVAGQDIRITKTHMALTKTLTELLEKKSFQKITVNDICQGAMVSRSTFYKHFEDKYKLMLFCLQAERQRLDGAVQSISLREYIHMSLTSVFERRKVFRNLLKAEIDMELFSMFQNFYYDCFSDVLTATEQQGIKRAGSIPLLASFYSSGLTGMVIWWIEQDFSVDIEEMAACQYSLLSDLLPDLLTP